MTDDELKDVLTNVNAAWLMDPDDEGCQTLAIRAVAEAAQAAERERCAKLVVEENAWRGGMREQLLNRLAQSGVETRRAERSRWESIVEEHLNLAILAGDLATTRVVLSIWNQGIQKPQTNAAVAEAKATP